MSYHPRFECKDIASFQTTRTRNSELWFVNNTEFEDAVMGYLARYATRHEIKLYAFALTGNHTHNLSHFPLGNRSGFMRDLNSATARAVPRYQESFAGGRVFARRFSTEYIPADADIEDRFFYTVLQPVQDGLVDDIRDYPGYNCFEDAVTGRKREWRVVNWKEYNAARKRNPEVAIEDYTDTYTLQFARLPGYEQLSQESYESMMRKKLIAKISEAIKKRKCECSLGAERLAKVQPGSLPKSTKTSGPHDHRPRILSTDAGRRAAGKDWYFTMYSDYRRASKRYREGDLNVEFPQGTYKPPIFTVALKGAIPIK